VVAFGLSVIADGVAQEAQKPANVVIVAIDRSMSFQARQQNAIDSTLKFLDQIASRKLGRWEGKNDKIVIVSLDAMPAVLWRGNLQELKALSSADWSKQFAARSDYQRCTDVTGAFSLAGEEFANSDSGPTYKYLLVFSDLIHEPPTTSASNCAKPDYAPTADFPWATLQDVSVSVLWLPVNQKLLWQRAVREHGLAAQVALYSDSESSAVQIPPPPPAKMKITQSERIAEASRFKSLFAKGIWAIGVLGGAVVFSLIVAIVSARRRGRAPQVYSRPQLLTPAQLRARNAGTPSRRN
jgi:hypothetical protein